MELIEPRGVKQRVTRKQYQALLLEGRFFWNGKLLEWKGKHLGAGIYEVWEVEAT